MFELGVVGCGNMAGAILSGILDKQVLSGNQIAVCDPNVSSLQRFTKRGVKLISDHKQLAENSKMLLLGVKPQVVGKILPLIEAHLAHRPIVVSIAAGKPLSFFEQALPAKTPIIRVMPNMNAQIGQSMTGIAGGENATESDLQQVKQIFEAVGNVEVLAEEELALFTAIAGCSPAWTFRYIEALATQAVAYGFKKDQATRIVAQAVLGSAVNVLESQKEGVTAASLIDKICSPGGTTVAGLLAMEDSGFSAAARKAVKAAVEKDQAMQNE